MEEGRIECGAWMGDADHTIGVQKPDPPRAPPIYSSDFFIAHLL